ncbi:amidohydrolase family protein [uncultured Methanobrevibacter sp.]|uniref:amidohydrolase family protein n=1 Tax=uncultured Methanobrevibacter sp. TaxID=253161 RepID=UPI0026002927|nr:amidohydrolase family protein [uncultured Methanobrevibacter sp.]
METNNILIKNSIILNPKATGTVDEYKSSLLIENNKISLISEDIEDSNADYIIDAQGKILMPGLINTHSHIPMTLFRGYADDLNLDTWLNDYIWPIESHLNSETIYNGTMLGAIEMIKSGTTTFSDMYFYMGDVAKAIGKAGIRGVLSYSMIDFGDEQKRENEFKESISLIKNHHNTYDGRITTMFGPHSIYTTSPELLRRVRKEANKYNLGIHIHMNETQKEIDDCMDLRGIRPFEYLDDLGILSDDIIAAHCVWLSDNEIDLIKKYDVKVSHNPCSNAKLASGIAPISKLIDNGICVSIGTDGSSSNNNLDMFEEMKFTALLQKAQTLNPEVLSAERTLSLATINGANALGLENLGSIEEGKLADIILINTNRPNFSPINNNTCSNIVYSANGSNVDSTIVNGEILMENRKLTNLNETDILKNANETIDEMIKLKD